MREPIHPLDAILRAAQRVFAAPAPEPEDAITAHLSKRLAELVRRIEAMEIELEIQRLKAGG